MSPISGLSWASAMRKRSVMAGLYPGATKEARQTAPALRMAARAI